MKKSFQVEKKYMLIPVCAERETKKAVSFWAEEKKIYEFAIPVNEDAEEFYGFHYYAPLNLQEYIGKEIAAEGEVPETFLNAVTFSDSMPRNTQSRPLIHFTPNVGWMNDPNGLICQNGEYQMFFQYNPFDTKWENMCWGHAVSKDLLHWEQLDTALFPDEDGTMFSGSGIVNEKGLLGLPEDAQIYFYTCAGNNGAWSKDKPFRQKIAYSMDGGRTVAKKDGFIVDCFAEGNRDPKVYWHEETKAYYMALYMSGNEFMVLRSENLEDWTVSQKLELPEAWECPDLRPIPVEGGGSKWIFWSADGFYFIGTFDGYKFQIESGKHNAYQTKIPYAAQTWWGTEDVITIPWLRTSNHGKMYTGGMGIPRKLTLAQTENGLRLRQVPVDSFEAAKQELYRFHSKEQKKIHQVTVKEECALEIKIDSEKSGDFTIDLYETIISYNASDGKLMVGKETVEFGRNIADFSLIADGEFLEVTAENGLIMAAAELESDRKCGPVKVETSERSNVSIYAVR